MKLPSLHTLAVSSAALAVITGSVVMNAPDALPFLWCLKAATTALSALALLFVNPDAMLAALKAKKDMVAV